MLQGNIIEEVKLKVKRQLTQPLAAIELHSHAHNHGVVRHWHEADEPSDDGGFQVLQHHIVGISVALNDLQMKMWAV